MPGRNQLVKFKNRDYAFDKPSIMLGLPDLQKGGNSMNKKRVGRIIAVLTFVAIAMMAADANAQQGPLFFFRDSGWANSGVQPTPPAALIMSSGVCIAGPNCNDFGNGADYLNPLTFYPSNHTQTVTITAAWGSTFDTLASVFAQGGQIDYSVIQVLSNDGLIPSNFFQNNQGSGGSANLRPATVTSVEVQLAPFVFQQTSGGWWVAVGSDGNPPTMNISVYGTY